MPDSSEKILQELIAHLSTMPEVKSIGISGSKNPLPKAGEGDIDIFIYCDTIPSSQERQSILDGMENTLQGSKVGALAQGHSEIGDFTLINGVETWLMYFSTADALSDLIRCDNSVLLTSQSTSYPMAIGVDKKMSKPQVRH